MVSDSWSPSRVSPTPCRLTLPPPHRSPGGDGDDSGGDGDDSVSRELELNPGRSPPSMCCSCSSDRRLTELRLSSWSFRAPVSSSLPGRGRGGCSGGGRCVARGPGSLA